MGRTHSQAQRSGPMPALLRFAGLVLLAVTAGLGIAHWATADPYLPMFIHSSTPVQGRVDLEPTQPGWRDWCPAPQHLGPHEPWDYETAWVWTGSMQHTPAPVRPAPPTRTASDGPIDMWNGEVEVFDVDLVVPGRGIPTFICRVYSSRADFIGPFGHNWDWPYERRIYHTPGVGISLTNGLGREDFYPEAGPDSAGNISFIAPTGVFETLVQRPDSSYLQENPSGVQFEFDPSGRLIRIADRAENEVVVKRAPGGQAVALFDTHGRQFTINHGNPAFPELITKITDPCGRELLYTYDASLDLIRVRSPIVAGTPNGNDYPNGKTTLYTYSSGFSDSRLNHNLLRVIEPAYNVNNNPAASQAVAAFTYSSVTDPNQLGFDRVVAIRTGSDQGGPQSSPALVVGGTATFTYSVVSPADQLAPPGAALRTDESDANGNIRLFYFGTAGHVLRRVDTMNRTIRPGDTSYVTDYSYGTTGLLDSVGLPRGNTWRYSYDVGSSLVRSRGNLCPSPIVCRGTTGNG